MAVINGTSSADSLVGGTSNDILSGFAGNDTLNGGSGQDTMYGGTGDDTYIVGLGDVVSEDIASGLDTVLSEVDYALPVNVEILTLTGVDALLGTGNDLGNKITGNTSDNTLEGNGGNDTLEGGDGSDILAGGDGMDSLVGGEHGDYLYGGTGADTLIGGPGSDYYYIDAADFVFENASDDGTDTVTSPIDYALLAGFENLVLTGAAVRGMGNDAANMIVGNGRSNVLTGGAGDDILIDNFGADSFDGGLGNDGLYGGFGTDTALYGGHRAAYTVSKTGADSTVSGPEGTDTLSSIERIQFSGSGIAFDLASGEAAARTVLLIGAAFDGPAILQHPDWVGTGLRLFDSGLTMLQVCEMVIGVLGHPGNATFVNTVYENVVGTPPSDFDREFYIGLLQGSGGTMSQAQLLEIAANAPVNTSNIDLTGLQQAGVEFI